MKQREQHRELMVEWAGDQVDGQGRFIADGPFDWDAWENDDQRILFLLKEAYDSDLTAGKWLDEEFTATPLANRWTLRSIVHHIVCDGGAAGAGTWANLFLWARAMTDFQRDQLPDWEIPDAPDEVWEALRRCSFVNLKKHDGTSSSTDKDLTKHLLAPAPGGGGTNLQFLERQIKLIQPRLVICCSSYHPLRAAADRDQDWIPELDGKWGIGQTESATWFDYWHPGWYAASRFLLVQGLHAMRSQLKERL